jgi:hypothetical protein
MRLSFATLASAKVIAKITATKTVKKIFMMLPPFLGNLGAGAIMPLQKWGA